MNHLRISCFQSTLTLPSAAHGVSLEATCWARLERHAGRGIRWHTGLGVAGTSARAHGLAALVRVHGQGGSRARDQGGFGLGREGARPGGSGQPGRYGI
jgi:hypothetical protein